MMPELAETLFLPDEPPILELDELWSFVLKKANKRSHLDCFMSANPASCRFRNWESFRSDLSKIMGKNTACLSRWTLFHGLLEGISIGDSTRTAYGCRERIGRNGAR